jgi:hypothetical protein
LDGKSKKIVPKISSVTNLICITNYDRYQAGDTENCPEDGAENGTGTRMKRFFFKKTFLSNSDEVQLAELLLEKLLTRNPKHKRPNLQTWAKEVDLMIRRASRTPDEIRRVIEWSQADPFWQTVILSPGKLREKFDQLTLRMNATTTPSQAATRHEPHTALKCPSCGRRIVTKSDLLPDGCVFCQVAAQGARA